MLNHQKPLSRPNFYEILDYPTWEFEAALCYLHDVEYVPGQIVSRNNANWGFFGGIPDARETFLREIQAGRLQLIRDKVLGDSVCPIQFLELAKKHLAAIPYLNGTDILSILKARKAQRDNEKIEERKADSRQAALAQAKNKIREKATKIWSEYPTLTINQMCERAEIKKINESHDHSVKTKTVRAYIADLKPDRSPGRPVGKRST